MKQSTFKHEWTITGSHRTVTGRIEVMMNYSSKTVTGTHAITHDDFTKQVPQHRIQAFIDNGLWWKDDSISSENLVLSEVERCKKQMLRDMQELSNAAPSKTFADKMADLGFTNTKS